VSSANVQRITRDKQNLQLLWDRNLPPLATFAVGDVVEIETADNFGLFKDMHSEDDVVEEMSLSQLNPLTGPFVIEGAQPGDTLVVEVLDITVEDQGHICLIPNVGVLRNHTKVPHTKIWRIENGEAVLNEDVRFPIRPVIGTWGTMPADEGIHAIYPGPHGGNLDDTNLVVGSVYYMPVFHPGALMMVGDVHANQGDSEIAMGIEIDGTVTLKILDLVRGERIPYARIETTDRWVFPADAPTLEEAIEQSALYAAEFLVERLGITMEDATYLLCAVGDVRISQAAFAHYNVTVRTEVPKSVDRKGRLAGYLDRSAKQEG
jgi:amidase